ncbi:MAG: hypothetical protein CVV02_01705 [Firmicutes bacterium HGW-Firmicutes-7]|nr:MAG: hypothetical protein CVV02_01705 [Firmicutes bacterium HGW-Firmicutes-7]
MKHYTFKELVEKDGTDEKDLKRRALFWILASNEDLNSRVDYFYDFKERNIKLVDLKNDESSVLDKSSTALICLAFNLYNDSCGELATVSNIFNSIYAENFDIAIEAIRIRFPDLRKENQVLDKSFAGWF